MNDAIAVRWLPTNALSARFGKTTRTIVNWEATRPFGFPLPARINGRKYWDEREIIEWEKSLTSKKISEVV